MPNNDLYDDIIKSNTSSSLKKKATMWTLATILIGSSIGVLWYVPKILLCSVPMVDKLKGCYDEPKPEPKSDEDNIWSLLWTPNNVDSPQFRLSYYHEKCNEKHVSGILKKDDTLTKEDCIKIPFRPLQEGSYVYVLIQDTEGKCTIEFPNEHQQNPVNKGKEYYVHKHFDDIRDGDITVFFQAHTKPVDKLERRQASKDDCKKLGESCKSSCFEDVLKFRFTKD
ncbi:MAG: hypothetical protein BWK78_01440 [Thiotrichaceae bacterium IS1]|nr:MAG: hypothetical protein BWK78_01440 [Thiotrichaceae bacterium IS1]